jgi:hypothetical protein
MSQSSIRESEDQPSGIPFGPHHRCQRSGMTWECRTSSKRCPRPSIQRMPNGLITFYNKAAVELWGSSPELGKSEFCGSWKLY